MSSNFLKKIRELKRLSLAEIAEKVGVTRQSLWSFETQKNNLSLNVLEKLCDVLGCTVGQMLGKEPIDNLSDSLDNRSKLENPSSPMRLYSSRDHKYNEKYMMEAFDIMKEINTDFYSAEEKQELFLDIYEMVYAICEEKDEQKTTFEKNLKRREFLNEKGEELLARKRGKH